MGDGARPLGPSGRKASTLRWGGSAVVPHPSAETPRKRSRRPARTRSQGSSQRSLSSRARFSNKKMRANFRTGTQTASFVDPRGRQCTVALGGRPRNLLISLFLWASGENGHCPIRCPETVLQLCTDSARSPRCSADVPPEARHQTKTEPRGAGRRCPRQGGPAVRSTGVRLSRVFGVRSAEGPAPRLRGERP